MKKTCLILALLATSSLLHAADLAWEGCRYQGEVVHNKPHGKGALTCPDGRQYTGAFANGVFHGQGQYLSPNGAAVFLAPFGLRSTQVKGMILIGEFQNGQAKGRFQVLQNGEHLFNMDFEKGMIKSMSVPKK